MKLLFINFSKGWGGLEMFSASLFCWLKERNFEVEFLVRAGTRLDSHLKERGHSPRAVRTMKYIDPRTMFLMRRLIRKEGFDIIHSFKSSDIWFSALSTRFLGRSRPKLIHHLQLIPKHSRKGLIRTWIYGCLDRVIAISELVKEEAIKYWPVSREKYRVLLNATDVDRFKPSEAKNEAIRKQLGIPEDALLLGQVGQVCPIKGQLFVLKTALPLLRENQNLYMLIAGAPPADALDYEREVKEFIKVHNLENRVKLLGFRRDVPELFAAIDVFILGSVYEPFGLVLIEAMASGCITIASDAGGVPEIVIDAKDRYLYEPENHKSLESKLKRAISLTSAERESISRLAIQKVKETFSLEVFIPALKVIYLEVLESRTSLEQDSPSRGAES